MGKYFCDTETVRVTFDDDQWVDVKEEFSQEDQDYMIDQMARAETTNGKNTSLSLHLGKLAMLERGIVAWSFTDDQGKPVPVTKKAISTLRLRYRERVLTELNRLTEEAGRFLAPTTATECTSPSTGN